ncbi:MAG: T9SS type A sorting domain-containing protein [Rhodothermales bacterium]|nr:T9SS type A sorting domain-containing protein [Rhodothermales bacterium]MBO6778300.1 T9SS type A sorting domain-containing protein [Rhodothermales bacterium]
MRRTLLILLLLMGLTAVAPAQELLVDLNTTPRGLYPKNLLKGPGGTAFFTGWTEESGREPWVFEGGVIRQLVDLTPGTEGSNLTFHAANDSLVFFTRDDAELWVSDGHETRLVTTSERIIPSGVFRDHFVFVDRGDAYRVRATDGSNTVTLFTGGYTRGLYDWNGGPLVANDRLYFFGIDNQGIGMGLWSTDLTEAATYHGLVQAPGSDAVVFGDRIIYGGWSQELGDEVWTVNLDGTNNQRQSELGVNARWEDIGDFVVGSEEVFFLAQDLSTGWELFRTDGTAAGTVLVKDLAPGLLDAYPEDKHAFRDGILFTAWTPEFGKELWFSNGDPDGTIMLGDIEPGRSGSDPVTLAVRGNRAWFCAVTEATGMELWVTDGTPEGTRLVSDFAPGAASSTPEWVALLDDSLLISASTPDSGQQLRSLDLTGESIATVGTRISSGSLGSFPEHFARWGEQVVFAANSGLAGAQMWQTDGTPSGTRQLAQSDGTGIFETRVDGDRLHWRTLRGVWVLNAGESVATRVFEGNLNSMDVAAGMVAGQVWRDGAFLIDAETGEVLVRVPDAWNYALTDDGQFFTDDDHKLYRYTRQEGLSVVMEIPAGERIRDLHGAGSAAFFRLLDGNDGKLWMVDGSGARAISEQPLSTTSPLLTFRGESVFRGWQGLYITDSAAESFDILASGDYFFREALVHNDRFYYSASTRHGFGVYESDGTRTGSRILAGFDQPVEVLTVVGDEILVAERLEPYGTQLWVTGAHRNTRRLGAALPGATVDEAATTDRAILFRNGHPESGSEPFVLSATLVQPEPDPIAPELPEDVGIPYPNPATKVAQVRAPLGATVQVFDMLGRLRGSYTGDGELVDLNAASRPAGVYMVRTSLDGFVRTSALTIVR